MIMHVMTPVIYAEQSVRFLTTFIVTVATPIVMNVVRLELFLTIYIQMLVIAIAIFVDLFVYLATIYMITLVILLVTNVEVSVK